MRRLVMWNLVTLDGYFEGEQSWEVDFLQIAWGEELEQFSLDQAEEIGALVFGRVTYEGMEAAWSQSEGAIADFMNSVPKFVASNTLQEATWNNSTLLRGDPVPEVARMKAEDGKDLFVFGSASLSASLMQQGLFDEYRIGLVPVFLGKGNSLFKPGTPAGGLDLISSRQLASGSMLLTYRPASLVAA